ncbi:group XIIB secretory phospholipase A2-like protein isoform X3 [Bubalus bubalis]|uniref:group XIIB secretory phospholipase A2-like protein isoform X3 n=1 Tax=Bubalus bubalis TaxID=89462 RepID=UPI001E1B9182|nr:group XIIB secretory phospholipase A2-like protein isoform X3 [Bubalus bubalis]
MTRAISFLILWLSLAGGLAQSDTSPDAEESYSDWGLRHIRGSFESVNSYFDSFLELLGGKNGVCQYRCRYGKAPMPRPGYKPQEPNGCSSYFLGLKMDLGIPAMTKCCNQLDVCYETCGANKYRCDAKFRWCLHSICSDLKRSLGFVSNVEGAAGTTPDGRGHTKAFPEDKNLSSKTRARVAQLAFIIHSTVE